MPQDFTMPKLGLTMTEGTIREWLVADGAHVHSGDAVLVIETDKVETEVEVRSDGILRVTGETGQTYECGDVIGYLMDTEQNDALAPTPAAEPSAVAEPVEVPAEAAEEVATTELLLSQTSTLSTPDESPAPLVEPAVAPTELPAASVVERLIDRTHVSPDRGAPAVSAGSESGRVAASPRARAAARDLGLGLSGLTGTGPGGRIVYDDVAAAEVERQVEQVRAEAARLEAERAAEVERVERERLEAERAAEVERVERERLEAERAAEVERLERERLEAERAAEAERLEAERVLQERLEAERREQERLEAELFAQEQDRLDAERAEAERHELAQLEAERLAEQQAEAARVEAERIANLPPPPRPPLSDLSDLSPLSDQPLQVPAQNAASPATVFTEAAAPEAPAIVAPTPVVAASVPEGATSTPAGPAATAGARMLADFLGIDLRLIPTETGSRLTREDVGAWVRSQLGAESSAGSSVEASTDAPALLQEPTAVIPFRGMRRLIADRMHSSLSEMAQLTLSVDVDVTGVNAERERRRNLGQSVPGYTAWVVAAASQALGAHPYVNSQITADGIALLPDVHVGVAVALDDGLIVPVVEHANLRSVEETNSVVADLAGRARNRKLTFNELEGATFSVTALGMFGVDVFTPVINPPNTAILGVGRLRSETAWIAGQPQERRVMTLSLTWDHRAFDGAPAAEFAQTIVRLLESPAELV